MQDQAENRSAQQVFILSPARAGGKRCNMLLNPNASFELAVRVRNGNATLGEIFSFMSGLYFRGKLVYANRFARVDPGVSGVQVITSNLGLLPENTIVDVKMLNSFSSVDIDPADARYVASLQNSAKNLATMLPSDSNVVLLGSIGTKKYTQLLLQIFGERLKFPSEFVGRGDMSRGGLLLRSAAANQELDYIPVHGAIFHGKRPPKLEPKRWT